MQYYNLSAVLFCLFYLCRCEEECVNMDEEGTCLERCSESMIVYLPGCDNETMTQRTCRQPVAKALGYICDYTRCECTDSKLWDEAAKKCVTAEECSDQTTLIEKEENNRKEQQSASFAPYVEKEYLD